MKVFCMNWDGKVERMVAAKTKKAAMAILGTTPHYFNNFATETGNDADIAVALSNPGAVFEKPYLRGGEWKLISR